MFVLGGYGFECNKKLSREVITTNISLELCPRLDFTKQFNLSRWHKIQHQFIKVEEEVAKLEEFRGFDEFSVMYQPFSSGISVIYQFL